VDESVCKSGFIWFCFQVPVLACVCCCCGWLIGWSVLVGSHWFDSFEFCGEMGGVFLSSWMGRRTRRPPERASAPLNLEGGAGTGGSGGGNAAGATTSSLARVYAENEEFAREAVKLSAIKNAVMTQRQQLEVFEGRFKKCMSQMVKFQEQMCWMHSEEDEMQTFLHEIALGATTSQEKYETVLGGTREDSYKKILAQYTSYLGEINGIEKEFRFIVQLEERLSVHQKQFAKMKRTRNVPDERLDDMQAEIEATKLSYDRSVQRCSLRMRATEAMFLEVITAGHAAVWSGFGEYLSILRQQNAVPMAWAEENARNLETLSLDNIGNGDPFPLPDEQSKLSWRATSGHENFLHSPDGKYGKLSQSNGVRIGDNLEDTKENESADHPSSKSLSAEGTKERASGSVTEGQVTRTRAKDNGIASQTGPDMKEASTSSSPLPVPNQVVVRKVVSRPGDPASRSTASVKPRDAQLAGSATTSVSRATPVTQTPLPVVKGEDKTEQQSLPIAKKGATSDMKLAEPLGKAQGNDEKEPEPIPHKDHTDASTPKRRTGAKETPSIPERASSEEAHAADSHSEMSMVKAPQVTFDLRVEEVDKPRSSLDSSEKDDDSSRKMVESLSSPSKHSAEKSMTKNSESKVQPEATVHPTGTVDTKVRIKGTNKDGSLLVKTDQISPTARTSSETSQFGTTKSSSAAKVASSKTGAPKKSTRKSSQVPDVLEQSHDPKESVKDIPSSNKVLVSDENLTGKENPEASSTRDSGNMTTPKLKTSVPKEISGKEIHTLRKSQELKVQSSSSQTPSTETVTTVATLDSKPKKKPLRRQNSSIPKPTGGTNNRITSTGTQDAPDLDVSTKTITKNSGSSSTVSSVRKVSSRATSFPNPVVTPHTTSLPIPETPDLQVSLGLASGRNRASLDLPGIVPSRLGGEGDENGVVVHEGNGITASGRSEGHLYRRSDESTASRPGGGANTQDRNYHLSNSTMTAKYPSLPYDDDWSTKLEVEQAANAEHPNRFLSPLAGLLTSARRQLPERRAIRR